MESPFTANLPFSPELETVLDRPVDKKKAFLPKKKGVSFKEEFLSFPGQERAGAGSEETLEPPKGER